MVLIHPYVALAAISVAVCAHFIGAKHFLARRFGKPSDFNQILHVRLGRLGIILLVVSAGGGFVMADILEIEMSFLHVAGGIFIMVFAVIGRITGWMLGRPNKNRALVKTIHGMGNFLLILACFNQIATGYKVFFM